MSKVKSEISNIRRRLSRLTDELEDLEQVISDDSVSVESEAEEDVVNLTEMAGILGISLATLRRYIKEGRLTPYRLGSKQYFLRSEIPQILKDASKK